MCLQYVTQVPQHECDSSKAAVLSIQGFMVSTDEIKKQKKEVYKFILNNYGYKLFHRLRIIQWDPETFEGHAEGSASWRKDNKSRFWVNPGI